MKKGKFIVIEGGEGSGKDTQVALLRRVLSPDTEYVYEPGSTNIGKKIRLMLMDTESKDMLPETELLLFYASRAQLVEEKIIPALDEGKNVVSNRFSPSTVAYQIFGRERPSYLPFLKHLEKSVVGEYKPDLCIILDISPEVGLERIKDRKNKTRFDEEQLSFHERVRKGYIQAVKELDYKNRIIDASSSPEEVHQKVLDALEDVLSLKKPL